MKNILLLIVFTTLLFACKKERTLSENRLAGTWIFQGQYLNADYNDGGTNVIIKGMTTNNTGELTIDASTDSFHFSNYYYEIDLPQTNIVRKSDKKDSTYITHTNFYGPLANIAASYTLSGKNLLRIKGNYASWKPGTPPPASANDGYSSEFIVGWSGDTLLLLDNYTSFQLTMNRHATLKFVRK